MIATRLNEEQAQALADEINELHGDSYFEGGARILRTDHNRISKKVRESRVWYVVMQSHPWVHIESMQDYRNFVQEMRDEYVRYARKLGLGEETP